MHFSSTTAAVLLSALSLPFLSEAGGCNPLRLEVPVCGKVINHSAYSGRWADLDGGPHLCHVYNWNGGPGSTGWNEDRIACKQNPLPKGETRGGISRLTDVDAITFHDRRWRIIWESGESHDLDAGTWAKFSNGETVTCENNVQVPQCRVKCEVNNKHPDSCVGA